MTGKVLTIAQQKGGSGKTTIAANIALEYVARGKSVAMLDTDPQGSLGRWFMMRRERMDGDAGFEFGTSSAWGISYECEKLRKLHDIVIIDTPPKIDADLRPALRESDLVLVPLATSQLDLWATEGVLELAARERKATLIVLNRAAARARLTAKIAAAVRELDTAFAQTQIGNRVVFAEALGEGKGVAEMARTGLAAQEITALVDEIDTYLD